MLLWREIKLDRNLLSAGEPKALSPEFFRLFANESAPEIHEDFFKGSSKNFHEFQGMRIIRCSSKVASD